MRYHLIWSKRQRQDERMSKSHAFNMLLHYSIQYASSSHAECAFWDWTGTAMGLGLGGEDRTETKKRKMSSVEWEDNFCAVTYALSMRWKIFSIYLWQDGIIIMIIKRITQWIITCMS